MEDGGGANGFMLQSEAGMDRLWGLVGQIGLCPTDTNQQQAER
jgi:hypothetical protein